MSNHRAILRKLLWCAGIIHADPIRLWDRFVIIPGRWSNVGIDEEKRTSVQRRFRTVARCWNRNHVRFHLEHTRAHVWQSTLSSAFNFRRILMFELKVQKKFCIVSATWFRETRKPIKTDWIRLVKLATRIRWITMAKRKVEKKFCIVSCLILWNAREIKRMESS